MVIKKLVKDPCLVAAIYEMEIAIINQTKMIASKFLNSLRRKLCIFPTPRLREQ